MLNNKHRQAEMLSAKAAETHAKGRIKEALELYRQAASAEEAALSTMASSKLKTRSILSVSIVSLLYKAERFDEAELRIFQLLGSASLENWAMQQLRELLQVVSDEKAVSTSLGRRYAGESITIALRGGEVGSGTGPLDLVLDKATAFRSLLYRVAEWKGDYPLRVSGNPPKELMQLVEARVSEPAPGSYRLEVRLTEPVQIDIFCPRRVQAQAVSDGLFEFLNTLTQGSPEQVEKLVPQPDYRKALLQLTKNVTPTGKRVKEVGIYRRCKDRLESVYLTDALPQRIRQALPRREEPQHKRDQLRGTLRALHLDENWLEITTKDGKHVKCDTVHDILDDVVGPMVNQEVVVAGPIRKRWGKWKLLAEDVDLVEDS